LVYFPLIFDAEALEYRSPVCYIECSCPKLASLLTFLDFFFRSLSFFLEL